MSWRVPLSEPSFGSNEALYLKECIDSGYVSAVGSFVGEFEDRFAAAIGADHAVACASGTAALHLALLAAGVVAGDEVWASDLTFIATVNAIAYCGARVVLVDSEEATWNLDPAIIQDELRRRHRAGLPAPKAIVAVHLFGHPADPAVFEVAAHHGVEVIEDAAEAVGARWRCDPLAGRSTGTAARLGAFSFNGNKLITTGNGGMIVSSDAALAERVRHLSTQAKVAGSDYEHDEIGFNYRLTNLAAAVGLAQMERLPELLAARRRIAVRYDTGFAGVDAVELAPNAPWAERSAWLYALRFDSARQRDDVRAHLAALGIEARPVWTPMRRQQPYRRAPVLGGDRAGRIADTGLCLPSSATLAAGEQDEIISAVIRAVSP